MPAGVAALLGSVAGYRLPAGTDDRSPGPTVVDRGTWQELAPLLTGERLTGLATLALSAGDLVLEDDGDVDDLARRDLEVQAQALRAERLTLALCEELETAGMPHVILKGPAYAHRLYPGPSARPFIDVDLLVPSGAVDELVARYERAGATRDMPELRPGFDRRFAKSVTLRHASGTEIDLHRTLTVGPLAQLVSTDDLWTGPSVVEVVPGRTIPVLHPDLAFLHACLHLACGGDRRWLSARDVIETHRAADLDRCQALARGWAATGVVRTAIRIVGDRGLEVPPALRSWAGSLPPSSTELRVARAYEPSRRNARSLALASWPHVHGLGPKLGYARAFLDPSPANRRARQRSRLAQLRRLVGGRG